MSQLEGHGSEMQNCASVSKLVDQNFCLQERAPFVHDLVAAH